MDSILLASLLHDIVQSDESCMQASAHAWVLCRSSNNGVQYAVMLYYNMLYIISCGTSVWQQAFGIHIHTVGTKWHF